MTAADFHNGLRILRSLDRDELVDAGVMADGDAAAWRRFVLDPYRWAVSAADAQFAALWALMERRGMRVSEEAVK